MKEKGITPYFIIITISALLFIPFLGNVHLFDWDEINFAESAREMLATGNYSRVMIDFQPFWEKPPLFFWMQVVSMKIFGVNEFAARFPNAICGIVTLCLIFFLGKRYFNSTFGYWWVLLYAGSFLPHFYFKSGIIDPWFNLFIFLSIICLFVANEKIKNELRFMALSGVFCGLAILTKGPVALLLVLFTAIVFSISKRKKLFHAKSKGVFLLTTFGVASIWFGWETLKHGTWFLQEFYQYHLKLFSKEDAGHGGPFYFHAVVLLLGCFPASVFAITGFFRKHDADETQLEIRRWLLILFCVVLALFSIVQTKIIHYSSLCYLPLTFMGAWEVFHLQKNSQSFYKIQLALLLFIGVIFGVAVAAIPILLRYPELITPYLKDPFAVANLEAEVHWGKSLSLIGIFFLTALLLFCFYYKRSFSKSIAFLLAASVIFLQAVLFSFVPRIERYTQGAAIDFYKSLQGKDVYVEVLHFKSYAHLFYTNKKPPSSTNSLSKEQLLHGEIDKPVYFVCKITKADIYRELPQLEEIESKNGFVFFVRNP